MRSKGDKNEAIHEYEKVEMMKAIFKVAGALMVCAVSGGILSPAVAQGSAAPPTHVSMGEPSTIFKICQ